MWREMSATSTMSCTQHAATSPYVLNAYPVSRQSLSQRMGSVLGKIGQQGKLRRICLGAAAQYVARCCQRMQQTPALSNERLLVLRSSFFHLPVFASPRVNRTIHWAHLGF